MQNQPKNTVCLWYEKDAQGAAEFYAATFPDSKVGAITKAPSDFPGGKKGDVLTVEFTVCGIPCMGLNGGPFFKQSEAFSFQIATDTKKKRTAFGTRSLGMVGRRASAVGARTSGEYRGRSRRALSSKLWRQEARRRSAHLTP